MYKIAICDDTEFERIQLEKHLKTYIMEKNIIATIYVFDHPELLLSSGETFDLYLLDIMMPMYNGIELGKILTEKSDVTILYFTTSVDFAIEAFRLQACHYVVKPYNQNDFYLAMDRAYTLIKKAQYINLDIGKDIVKLDIESISYCETKKNYQEIYFTIDREPLTIRATAKAFYEQMKQFNRFIQGGTSYIINYTHIKSIVKNCVELEDGTNIYIPVKAMKKFKDQYTILLSKEV